MSSDDVDFQIVNAVNESWDVIKKIPNYDLVAGEILFRKWVLLLLDNELMVPRVIYI